MNMTRGQTINDRFTSVALTYSKIGFTSEVCAASGIRIADYCIISHGSLLNERVTSNTEIRDFFKNMKPGELTSVPKEIGDDLRLRVYQQKSKNIEIYINNDRKISNEETPDFATLMDNSLELVENEGSIIVAWKCPLLENTLRDLFFGWNFEKIRKNDKSLLSIFLIVSLKENHEKMLNNDERLLQTRRILHNFVDNCDNELGNPARSANVEISSTPFGNPVFIDSLSRGIVSNIFGDDGCVMLTDANAVPGSEGAPVYVIRQDGTRSYICGMVIAPLSWCRGEWVDYTFAASLLPCLQRLLVSRIHRQVVDHTEMIIADSLDKSLVLVSCGDGWGTGIVFDARTGTIITCSHVVHKAPESRIKVVLRRGDDSRSSGSSSSTSLWAKLVYRTANGEPYDVAVLRIEPREIEHTLRSIKIADDRPVIRGETVGSAGFPFFSSRYPTITRGNVSGTIDCMLRTTCCVQSGSSGGPIVRWSTGEMLGMVVCNAITTNTTRLYPRLNMAVPLSILKPPIDEYIRTGRVKALDDLGTTDPIVRRTWNFHRLPSSKI